jgi:hypothetical protein
MCLFKPSRLTGPARFVCGVETKGPRKGAAPERVAFMTLLGRRRALAPEWPKSGLARDLSRQRTGRMTLHRVMSMLVAGIYNVR